MRSASTSGFELSIVPSRIVTWLMPRSSRPEQRSHAGPLKMSNTAATFVVTRTVC